MKISSLPSPLPFKMTAAVPHMPAHLGHFHITSCDSSLQLPGLPFCLHQINTGGNGLSQIPFTASNCAGQTQLGLTSYSVNFGKYLPTEKLPSNHLMVPSGTLCLTEPQHTKTHNDKHERSQYYSN